MECHKCGARLPFGTYGQVKCEFCNTINYIPVPGEKEGVAEKVGPKKEPIKKEEVQKPETPVKVAVPVVEKELVINTIEPEKSTSKKSPIKMILIGIIIIMVVISGFIIYSRQTKLAGERFEAKVREATYSTPAPTSSYRTPTTTPVPITTSPPTTPRPTTTPPTKDILYYTGQYKLENGETKVITCSTKVVDFSTAPHAPGSKSVQLNLKFEEGFSSEIKGVVYFDIRQNLGC